MQPKKKHIFVYLLLCFNYHQKLSESKHTKLEQKKITLKGHSKTKMPKRRQIFLFWRQYFTVIIIAQKLVYKLTYSCMHLRIFFTLVASFWENGVFRCFAVFLCSQRSSFGSSSLNLVNKWKPWPLVEQTESLLQDLLLSFRSTWEQISGRCKVAERQRNA